MVQNYEKKSMFFCSSIQNFVFLSAICFWGMMEDRKPLL